MATYTHPYIQHVVDCISLYQRCPGYQLTRDHGASNQCVLEPHIAIVSMGCELLLALSSCYSFSRGDLSGQNTGRNPHSATPSRSHHYTSPSSVQPYMEEARIVAHGANDGALRQIANQHLWTWSKKSLFHHDLNYFEKLAMSALQDA